MKKMLIGLVLLSSLSAFSNNDIESLCETFVSEAVNRSLVCGLQKMRVEEYGQSPTVFNGLNDCVRTAKVICKRNYDQSGTILDNASMFMSQGELSLPVCNLQRNIIINLQRSSNWDSRLTVTDDIDSLSRAVELHNQCHSDLYSLYQELID